jgi:hypothetical protein
MLLFGGVWIWGLWVRKVGCFKLCLLVHTDRSIEDRGAEDALSCGGLAPEVSEDKNFSVLPGDHSCDILVKNVAAFALVQRVCLR